MSLKHHIKKIKSVLCWLSLVWHPTPKMVFCVVATSVLFCFSRLRRINIVCSLCSHSFSLISYFMACFFRNTFYFYFYIILILLPLLLLYFLSVFICVSRALLHSICNHAKRCVSIQCVALNSRGLFALRAFPLLSRAISLLPSSGSHAIS